MIVIRGIHRLATRYTMCGPNCRTTAMHQTCGGADAQSRTDHRVILRASKLCAGVRPRAYANKQASISFWCEVHTVPYEIYCHTVLRTSDLLIPWQ